MSYFLNSVKYDTFVIDPKYFENYKGAVRLPLIEIFNKDAIEFDFTNVKIKCSDESLSSRDIRINKIFIDYGDGTTEILNEDLINKTSFLGNFIKKSWQITSHSFISEKRHIYSDDLETNNYPSIIITFFNQFNDKFYFIVPYKILYKSYYDEGSEFTLLNANINNNNITSFSLRERKNNSIVVISSKSFLEEEQFFVNPSSIVDESDDYYVDDDEMLWNWSTIPEIIFDEISTDFDEEKGLYNVYFKWKEKNVSIQNIKISRRTIGVNSSNEYTELTDISFDDLSYTDYGLPNNIYEYVFDIVGINDVSNKSYQYVVAAKDNPCLIYKPETKNLIEPNPTISSKHFTINFDINSVGGDVVPFEFFDTLMFKMLQKEKYLSFNHNILEQADYLDETKTQLTSSISYSLPLRTDTLPNGNYTLTVETKDKVGNTSTRFYNYNKEELDTPSFIIDYSIGDFKNGISINGIKLNPNTNPSINTENILLTWDFCESSSSPNPGNVDYFDLVIEKIEP